MDQQKPQQATDLLANVHFLPSTGSSVQGKSSNEQSRLSQKALNKLWLKMTEIYGHRWTANFGESANPEHSWSKILGDLNGQQLANGLSAVSVDPQYDWPPSANVFRSLCMQMPGFPSEDQAWTEALIGKYTHEAVKVAAEATGLFDLRTAKHSDKALRQNFERNYAIVQRRAQNAQPLDGKIPMGISHDTKTPRQVQLAASHQEARDLMAAQGIPNDPKAARALLLAKVGIRRDNHA